MTSSTTAEVAAREVMHHGVITAGPEATLTEVAAQMAGNRVHCVVVEGLSRDLNNQETLVWGILSDLDLMRALAAGRPQATAGELAGTEIVTVDPEERIEEVARVMAEHELSHLIVVSPTNGEPIGVISSLDVARGYSHHDRLAG